ncbi:helix-turn-helix transcriptional regulator [Micromonospora sp. NPDC005220]|uniref:helix-turn-helix domain-containing protein n=1 Tax=Micromonospora sp. NPDC005220 TaxID=3155589 RepID=UPI0033B36337
MSSTRLVTLLGAAVRHQRHLRDLNQRQLAALAEVDQAAVARFERGERAPTVPVLERLLAAMDVQLVVAVEPLDAHLDALIDDLAARPIAERSTGWGWISCWIDSPTSRR